MRPVVSEGFKLLGTEIEGNHRRDFSWARCMEAGAHCEDPELRLPTVLSLKLGVRRPVNHAWPASQCSL